jgi:hypothetical protein
MPGEHRVDGDLPPVRTGAYLHPFKITNAYSLLMDLGYVAAESQNAEV